MLQISGILLYTSVPDSEGHWAGLWGQAYPNNWESTWTGPGSRCEAARQIRYVLNTPAHKSIHYTKRPAIPASFYQIHHANAGINIWRDRCSFRLWIG